ncbi:MAG: PAS domain S-box protein, partial [Desulfobacteraceae bacterium]
MSDEHSILINTLKDGVFVIQVTADNQPGRFIRVNEAACSLLGYSTEEFAEMTPGDIQHPEAMRQYAEQALRELQEKEHAVFETVLVAKNGIKIPVEINARIGRIYGTPHIVAAAIDRTARKEADDFLRENETRLNLAMDATNTGLWDWHVQTGEVIFNEKWAEIAGYTLKELEPVTIQTWMNLCHPEDLKASNRKLERYFAGEIECYECEARIKHKDGSWRWIRDRGKVVEWDDHGNPLRMIGTHTDIHLRKQYQQEQKKHARDLNERNKELNCLFEISRMVEDPGHSLDNILQKTITILAGSMQYPEYACGRIKIKDRNYLTENFTETSWKLFRDIMVNGCPEGCLEIFYLKPEPETKEGPFLRDEKNLLDAVAERLGHIIGRMQTEEKLRRSEQKFKDIFNSTGDAIFIHDMEGNFLEVNEVACRRLGYSRDELLRMSPMDLDIEEYRRLAPERILDVEQEGSSVFESAHRRKDGTVIPVEINSRKIEYEGNPVYSALQETLPSAG